MGPVQYTWARSTTLPFIFGPISCARSVLVSVSGPDGGAARVTVLVAHAMSTAKRCCMFMVVSLGLVLVLPLSVTVAGAVFCALANRKFKPGASVRNRTDEGTRTP
jgi:hypothetical protein